MSSTLSVKFPTGNHAYSAPVRTVQAMIQSGEAKPFFARGRSRKLLGCVLVDIQSRYQACQAGQTTSIDRIRVPGGGTAFVHRHAILNGNMKMVATEGRKGWDLSASTVATFSNKEIDAIAQRSKEVEPSPISRRTFFTGIGHQDGPFCFIASPAYGN